MRHHTRDEWLSRLHTRKTRRRSQESHSRRVRTSRTTRIVRSSSTDRMTHQRPSFRSQKELNKKILSSHASREWRWSMMMKEKSCNTKSFIVLWCRKKTIVIILLRLIFISQPFDCHHHESRLLIKKIITILVGHSSLKKPLDEKSVMHEHAERLWIFRKSRCIHETKGKTNWGHWRCEFPEWKPCTAIGNWRDYGFSCWRLSLEEKDHWFCWTASSTRISVLENSRDSCSRRKLASEDVLTSRMSQDSRGITRNEGSSIFQRSLLALRALSMALDYVWMVSHPER